MKKAVRHIRYHPTSQTYIVVTAVPDPFIVKDENNVAVHDGATPAATAAAGTAAAAANGTPVPTTAAAPAAMDATPDSATAPVGSTAAGVPNGTGTPASTATAAKLKSSGPGFRPTSDQQTLELVSPVTWETVDRYQLQEYEIVTSMETVSLESTQDASGRKKFMAVGTSVIKGEDSTMRGTVSERQVPYSREVVS
jgi:cleavage and polyadenylation specificity factor subunit 1